MNFTVKSCNTNTSQRSEPISALDNRPPQYVGMTVAMTIDLRTGAACAYITPTCELSVEQLVNDARASSPAVMKDSEAVPQRTASAEDRLP